MTRLVQLELFAAPAVPAETAEVEVERLDERLAAEHVYGRCRDAHRRWRSLCRRHPAISQKVAARRWCRADLDRWLETRRDHPDARSAYTAWVGEHHLGPRPPCWHRLSPIEQRAWRAFIGGAHRGDVRDAYAAYASVRGLFPDWMTYAQGRGRPGDPGYLAHAMDVWGFVAAARDADRSRDGDGDGDADERHRSGRRRTRHPDQMRFDYEVEGASPESLERLADGLAWAARRHYRDAVDAGERGHHRKAARLAIECEAKLNEVERLVKRAERARAQDAASAAPSSGA